MTWSKSFVSNIYQHSICDANSKRKAVYSSDGVGVKAMYRNLHIPLYFTVPKTSAVTGTHTWICQLKEMTSPIGTPVNITVESYTNKVKPEGLEIVDLKNALRGSLDFRVLQY